MLQKSEILSIDSLHSHSNLSSDPYSVITNMASQQMKIAHCKTQILHCAIELKYVVVNQSLLPRGFEGKSGEKSESPPPTETAGDGGVLEAASRFVSPAAADRDPPNRRMRERWRGALLHSMVSPMDQSSSRSWGGRGNRRNDYWIPPPALNWTLWNHDRLSFELQGISCLPC